MDRLFFLLHSPIKDVLNEGRPASMSDDFWNQFAARRPALEAALHNQDAAALTELVDELAEILVAFYPRLNINIGGGDPFWLSILSLPGAETLVESAPLTENWEISAGLPEYDPLESIQVEDDTGDQLSVRYADLDARVLPPKEGRVTIVCSLDADFDPSGPRAHLYQAVAEHVVFTILGGWPPELSQALLVPRNQTGKLRPLDQLRQQWINVIDSEPA